MDNPPAMKKTDSAYHKKRRDNAAEGLLKILEIMEQLRNPVTGCPWDLRQTKKEIGRCLIDEAYEVLDAIDQGSPEALREELGDLFFQIAFLARLAEESGEFDMAGIVTQIAEKMIRRHPHVFGDVKVKDAGEVKKNWDEIKKTLEKKDVEGLSAFLRIPRSLPALLRAQKITETASKKGFDWKTIDGVLEKIEEELSEFKAALASGEKMCMADEIGDLLFSMVNLSRFAGIDAEEALQSTNRKFMDRFAYIEKKLKERGKTPESSSLFEMDELWNESKRRIHDS
jgi:tetrapyrrole methylase family protein / MazG family protein